VLASTQPLDETLQALRAAGYAPVADVAAATPVIERSARVQPQPAPPTRATTTSNAPKDLRKLADTLLATGSAQPEPPTGTLSVLVARAPQLSSAERRLLAHALDEGAAVHIDYVNAEGNASSRVISDVTLDDNLLFAWCHLRQTDRVFALSRIQNVAPAPT
jgi:predicted DNA-binding transcriptional regulator YafY